MTEDDSSRVRGKYTRRNPVRYKRGEIARKRVERERAILEEEAARDRKEALQRWENFQAGQVGIGTAREARERLDPSRPTRFAAELRAAQTDELPGTPPAKRPRGRPRKHPLPEPAQPVQRVQPAPEPALASVEPEPRAALPAAPRQDRPGLWRVHDPRVRWPVWQKVVAFIQTMKVPDGPQAGSLINLMDWQIEMIREVYEPTLINSSGKQIRAIQKAVWSLARKNGKSSLAAGLLMSHMIGPVSQWGGQCFSVAYERNQAAIIFRSLASIIRQDLLFPHQFSITDSTKKIYTPWTNSTYQALSAESRSKHGLNPNFVIFDELAQFGSDRALFDVMETSFGAQEQPLMLTISTQADSDDAVLSELIDYGLQVQSGDIVDPTFHLTFFSLPDGLDPWDEKNWYHANPALGVFRSLDEMRNYARKAKESPAAEGSFLNLYHNRRISQVQTAISREVWEENAGYWPAENLVGLRCWAGLDLSARTDLTAFVMVFELEGETGPLAVLPFFWTPADTMKIRSERDKVPYDVWVKQGYMEAPEGTAIDYGYVAKRLSQLNTSYTPLLTGFDRWRIDVLKGWLKEINLDIPLEPMGQGFKDASLQIESLEEVLLNRRLMHGGHPVLRYSALGAKVNKDPAGGRKFDKAKSTSRIDGLVALSMALRARDVWYAAQRIDAEGEKRRSGYIKTPDRRERGLLVL
jgi:phage terminase large subunit-like protein